MWFSPVAASDISLGAFGRKASPASLDFEQGQEGYAAQSNGGDVGMASRALGSLPQWSVDL